MKQQNLKFLFVEVSKNFSGSYYKPTKTLTIKIFGQTIFTKSN